MPLVNCPGCGRAITLRVEELTLLIECARCAERFYPVAPAGMPPSPATVARRRADPEPEGGSLESHWKEAGLRRAGHPRPNRPRRRKKDERRYLPLVVAGALALAVLVSIAGTIAFFVSAGVLEFRAGHAAPATAVYPEPAPAPMPAVPPPPPVAPPPAVAAPPVPPPSGAAPAGPQQDLGGALPPARP